ncbi:hypothetical protein [Streptomyces sp. NBC_00503]|uniref:hypothetical protein n=1 Tax=Streptomyces sp. NBC_00503 TaxID=2903659 RepID=UPI002E80A549|nr:hypothetical protein [Streptomyces sp. NBC_00503]WUD82600.1 hypothetical protein OG490_19780 [Streptomyces sp. NBC_00503]
MSLLAVQDEASPDLFLLIWGILAAALGGVFSSRRGSARMRALVVEGLERSPRQQSRDRSVPSQRFLRIVGAFVVVGGLAAVPVSLVMMIRG